MKHRGTRCGLAIAAAWLCFAAAGLQAQTLDELAWLSGWRMTFRSA